MEAGEEKGGWETGFYFLIFTDIVKMGWDSFFRRKKTPFMGCQVRKGGSCFESGLGHETSTKTIRH